MPLTATIDQVEALYIGYFGRAGEPDGVNYWMDQINQGYSLSEMAASFAVQPEATSLYPFLSNPELSPSDFITDVYFNLFGRVPDHDGLVYWTQQLSERAGDPAAVGQFILDVLSGAYGENGSASDVATIENKVEAATYYTHELEEAGIGGTHLVDGHGVLDANLVDSAHHAVSGVTSNDSTVTDSKAGSDAAINEIVHGGDDGGTGGDGDGHTGGGGGGGGGHVDPFVNDYSDLTHTYSANELFAGLGNPANGFERSVNASQHIELGLDVRYRGDLADVDPSHPVDLLRSADLRFGYSVAQDGGIDLDHHTYTLEIDTDPTSAVNMVRFELRHDDTPDLAGGNHSASAFDWVQVDQNGVAVTGGLLIDDDGGNNAVSQNIQALHWYNGGNLIENNGEYTIRLTATDNYYGNVEAQTEITINPVTAAAVETDGSVAGGNEFLYAGTGNPNDGFHIATLSNGIELGLGARLAGVGPVDMNHLNSGNNIRVAYSISGLQPGDVDAQGGGHTGNYVVQMKIDLDPGASATNFLTLTLKDLGTVNSGTNNVSNSHFVWEDEHGNVVIEDDGGTNAVTQNIQNPFWFDTDATSSSWAAGEYDVELNVYTQDSHGNLVALVGQNHVVFEVAT